MGLVRATRHIGKVRGYRVTSTSGWFPAMVDSQADKPIPDNELRRKPLWWSKSFTDKDFLPIVNSITAPPLLGKMNGEYLSGKVAWVVFSVRRVDPPGGLGLVGVGTQVLLPALRHPELASPVL